MTKLEFFVFTLWGAALVLVALNIVYHVYFKITLIYMRFLDTIRFTLGMLYLRIRYFFSQKKKILSHCKTQLYRSSDTLRIRQSCPPCTTYIAKTILQPSQTITKEKGFKRSLREKLEDAILPIILGILIALLIRRK
jgi:hypothetical protein